MTPVPTPLAAFAPRPPVAAFADAFGDAAVDDLVDACPARVDVERPGDAAAREALLDHAFGPGRFAKTCERLRARRLPARGLSLVARVPGGAAGERDVVGTVRLWHVAAGEGAPVPALMLGPLAVEEAWRRHRLGAALMREAIGRAAALGHRAILLVGDEPYYRRFGFRRAPATLRMPGPVEAGRFLALELVPGALAGAHGLVRATGAIDLAAPAVRGARRAA